MSEVMEERRVDYRDLRDKVTDIDRDLSTLVHVVEDQVEASKNTNLKLDRVVDAITKHNVLEEKVNNMHANIEEGFRRRDEEIARLGKIQDGDGCNRVHDNTSAIKELGRSLDTVRDRVATVETDSKSFISGTVVRWAIGIVITLVLVTASVGRINSSNTASDIKYNNKEIVRLDKLVAGKIQAQEILTRQQEAVNANTVDTFEEVALEIHNVQKDLNRNYGQILGMQGK